MADIKKNVQETITIEVDGQKVVSRVFDFETMCLVQNKHYSGDRNGSYNMCGDAIPYLFESKLTEKQIEDIPYITKCAMSEKIWGIYYDSFSRSKAEAKNM